MTGVVVCHIYLDVNSYSTPKMWSCDEERTIAIHRGHSYTDPCSYIHTRTGCNLFSLHTEVVTFPRSWPSFIVILIFPFVFSRQITFGRRTYGLPITPPPLKTFIISYEIKQFFSTRFVDLLLRDFRAGLIVYVHGQQSWI